jgi:hypothetical protein
MCIHSSERDKFSRNDPIERGSLGLVNTLVELQIRAVKYNSIKPLEQHNRVKFVFLDIFTKSLRDIRL